MTGSLRVKKDYYYAVIDYKDANGKRRQKWISTGLKAKNNKRKAEEFLKVKLNEYEEGNVIITKDILFADFLVDWLEIMKPKITRNTYIGFKRYINGIIAPYFREHKIVLQKINVMDIEKFYSVRLKAGVSNNTIKHYHANISKCLKYAVKNNLIPYNPAERVELPPIDTFTGKTYSQEEMRLLLEIIKGTEIETPILLTVAFGLRRGEALGLRWSEVDFKKKTILIKNTVTGCGNSFSEQSKPKNKTSLRLLPIPPNLETYLLQVKSKQDEMKKLLKASYGNDKGYVCTWEDGRLVLPDHLSHKFHFLSEQAGLPRIRYHDLRHSVASLLLAQGFSLKEISELLGHSTISTTANFYSHLDPHSKAQSAETIAKVLGGETTKYEQIKDNENRDAIL